jgi:bacteriorhodopsin
VYQALAVSIMVASFVVAAWCFVAAARNRWIDWSHLIGLIVVELALLAQVVAAGVRIGGGDHPQEFATFLGYLVVSVVMLPLVAGLAFMERTRWGSVIAGAGALVVAVLVLRLQQVWLPLR